MQALVQVPALCDEIDQLNALLALAAKDHRDLVAAARATVTAATDGEHDPLYYLRDELGARGQLPPDERRGRR